MIRFNISLVSSLLLTAIFTGLTLMIDFSLVRLLIQTHLGYTYHVLLLFAILNNTYQVVTHVLTALKFSGLPLLIPGGAVDNQSVTAFTFHNQLDLHGWFGYFLASGEAPLLYVVLAGAHMSVAVMIFFGSTHFQDYYIRCGKTPLFFAIFRTFFVLLDACARACAVFSLCQLY